jgi:plastocyanin
MEQTRRTWLRATAAAMAGVGLAGCQGSDDEDATPTDGGDGNGEQQADGDGQNGEQQSESENGNGESDGPPAELDAAPEDVAIAAEWNAIRTRLRDPVILGHADLFDAGETVAAGIFERFETAAGDPNAHEALEEAGEEAYEGFEDGLGGLRDALAAGDLEAAHDEMKAADGHLREAQGATVGAERIKPLTLLVLGTHVEDAALLARIGEFGEAAHEFGHIGDTFAEKMQGMVAEVDADAAETVVEALDDAAAAAQAEDGGAATDSAAEAFDAATRSIYALVPEELAGAAHLAALQARGWDAAALARIDDSSAASIVQDTFAHFEEAQVHELLEEADHDSYEAFEDALEEYAGALDAGTGVEAAAERFATATLRAQFAVAGAPEAAPEVGPGGSGNGSDDGEADLEGGPNVVAGVPDDADHVVEMQAVAFEPAELTVQQGDTVAWRHAAGEPHSVTALADGVPADATYWAAGGFESEDAAREGWENGRGAVQSGEAYVHTFETAGEHEYVCIPHEAAGMVGTVVVE